MISINEKADNCCGCGLCEKVCPNNSINMLCDCNGFLYPSVNFETCTNCGLCEKVCAFRNKTDKETDFIQKYYAARSVCDDVLVKSASGGVFTVVSDVVLGMGGAVYGAVFDESFCVVHNRADDENGRNTMRGSKYVQSDIRAVYNSIAKDLSEDRYVIFTGTPCQVDAVKSYCELREINTDKLFLCDLICHGVNSPKLWRENLEYLRGKIGDISFATMRDKKYGSGYHMTVKGEHGSYSKHGSEDPFIRIFQKNYALRSSCFNCPYKCYDRISDLTIGDFHKAKQYHSEYCDGKGISVVLVNSQKGEWLMEKCSTNMSLCESTKEYTAQPNLLEQIKNRTERDEFFRYYNCNSFVSVLKKYTEVGIKNRLVGIAKRTAKMILRRK
ncbi:MAG: Coenzyme F420 hydrogenase/dehydrogenase, beta subunit C-terminal domain [Clostridia bacterium]|nr:Coenzyme F420 hydrogenase/dehydrogenase, beta subunit C-terminal domain [Clostridia bacterium]